MILITIGISLQTTDAESLRAIKYVSKVQNISSSESKTARVHTSAVDTAEELLIHETKTNSDGKETKIVPVCMMNAHNRSGAHTFLNRATDGGQWLVMQGTKHGAVWRDVRTQ
jgi:hypothetical protein